jgi:hypothetical protein
MKNILSQMKKLSLLVTLSLLCCHCSPFQSVETGGLTSTSQFPTKIDLKEKQPGIVKQSQILPSYSSCLNMPMTSYSATTRQSYKDLKTNLSDDGKSTTVSAPLLMAITQLAGDVCNDLIEYEKTNGLSFFQSFNLSQQSVAGSANLDQSVQKFASSCWGRSINDNEQQYIIDEFNKTNLGNTKGLSAAYFICTTMLASPEVVIY